MAEGSPYIKALYYWPGSDPPTMVNRIAGLVSEAKTLALSGFDIPVPVGANLSPIAQVMKAFYHLTEDPQELDQQTSLKNMGGCANPLKIHVAGCLGNSFFHECFNCNDTSPYFPPCKHAPNHCLLGRLMEDYGRPPCS